MAEPGWVDVGSAEELAGKPLQTVSVGRTRVALGWRNGRFAAISGVCNHVCGPLGEGRSDGDYMECNVAAARDSRNRRLERGGRKAYGPARMVAE